MDDATRSFVRSRARNRCEYCHLPQSGHEERFSVDHVIPKQHLSNDSVENLSNSCLRCNLHKGTNLSGLDPIDHLIVNLFNPRKQKWSDHFAWNGPMIIGITAVGRATVATLRMNNPERVRLRSLLLIEGILQLD
jgi:hypothetical protein